jgi:autotransporter passenger strand-loop-strand repeat protein
VFGSAIAETVGSGGSAYISSGGALSGATLNGGFLEILSGGTAGSTTIGFSSAGGTLRLDDSQHFGGWISGFGVPGGIDLADIAFGSGTTLGYAGNASSGVLTVSDGLHTAALQLLGQYAEANFTLQSNGHGGTLVVDPPIGDPYGMMVTPHS